MATQQETTEQSRALALKFVELGTTRKLDQLVDILGPDALWTIAVDKALAGGYGGSKPAAETIPQASTNLATLDEYSFESHNMVVEGNRAFIDVVAYGKGPGPVEYRQNYAWVFTSSLKSEVSERRQGKITDVKVWCDPNQVKAWAESMGKYKEQSAAPEAPGNA
ncbi:hypothetical protein PG984_015600 [Apiospora sp. TS-2023a]